MIRGLFVFNDCRHDRHRQCRRVLFTHQGRHRTLVMQMCACPCHARDYAAQLDRLDQA